MKILIADDHQLFIEGISHFVAEQGWQVIGLAKNGLEVFRLVEEKGIPDLLILDIQMPEMDGVEVAKKIKKENPEVKILILSMHIENEFIRHMFNLGVEGYILKDTGKENLIKAIKTIHSGDRYYEKKVMDTFLQALNKPKNQSNLSQREIDIIRLIADQKTTGDIAEELFLSKHTVETHRKNILLKLGLKNSAGLIKYAMKNGLID